MPEDSAAPGAAAGIDVGRGADSGGADSGGEDEHAELERRRLEVLGLRAQRAEAGVAGGQPGRRRAPAET